MKELSIEEKAKAYDEAKARMSRAFNSNRCTIGFMNEIFPELKESEDERIRKELIAHCRNTRCVTEEGAERIAKWIAWLEKQGEKKPQRIISAEAKEAMYNKPAWSEEDEEYINDLIGVFDGQQYQAHSDEEIVKWLKSIRLPYNKEWDENDEEMLRSIIATCELAEQDRDSSPARHLLEMQLNWLKSLKQRIGG